MTNKQSSSDPLDEILEQLQYGTIMSENQEPMLTNNRNVAVKAINDWHLQKCRSYLPEKKTLIINGTSTEYNQLKEYEKVGWNDCLDTITKRIEEDK